MVYKYQPKPDIVCRYCATVPKQRSSSTYPRLSGQRRATRGNPKYLSNASLKCVESVQSGKPLRRAVPAWFIYGPIPSPPRSHRRYVGKYDRAANCGSMTTTFIYFGAYLLACVEGWFAVACALLAGPEGKKPTTIYRLDRLFRRRD